MSQSLLQKLKIKPTDCILLLNKPTNYIYTIHLEEVSFKYTSDKNSNYQHVHCFIQNKKELEQYSAIIAKHMTSLTTSWIFFPKKTSGIQTDITRDDGWEVLNKYQLKRGVLISFNETWSAFSCILNTGKEECTNISKDVSGFINSTERTITLPTNMQLAFAENSAAKIAFDQLSFTNKKEYVLWIVTAKKEATQQQRLNELIVKLLAGYKNPYDK